MSDLGDAYKSIISGKIPDDALLVPLMIWLSGDRNNIEVCQRVNKKILNGNRKVLIVELALSNKLTRFIKYPSSPKGDDKLDFYYNDLCKYFGWTRRELSKNLSILDLESLKEVISFNFGYENAERKKVGASTLKWQTLKRT
jgi:hypothetical protein